MPSEILPNVAPELLIQIFKSLNSFADVTSLSSTCRKMSVVWKRNARVICDAILTRTIPCFTQAQDFINAQEKAESDKQPDFSHVSPFERARWRQESVREKAEGDKQPGFGHWSPVERAQRMIKWADTTAKACSYFEDEAFGLWALSECPAERKKLTLAERTDFARAYYRATTYATLGKDFISDELMSSWDMIELGQLRDVIRFVLCHCNRDLKQELGVSFADCSSKPWPVGLTSHISWMYLDGFTTLLETVLYRHTSKAEQDTKTDFKHFPSILRGRYPEEYKPNRGARLADVYKSMTRKERRLFSPRYKIPANQTTNLSMLE